MGYFIKSCNHLIVFKFILRIYLIVIFNIKIIILIFIYITTKYELIQGDNFKGNKCLMQLMEVLVVVCRYINWVLRFKIFKILQQFNSRNAVEFLKIELII